jgi:hypothetical protein
MTAEFEVHLPGLREPREIRERYGTAEGCCHHCASPALHVWGSGSVVVQGSASEVPVEDRCGSERPVSLPNPDIRPRPGDSEEITCFPWEGYYQPNLRRISL